MTLPRITSRARACFAGMAMLLGVLAATADGTSGSLLVGVALTAGLLLITLVRANLPIAITRIAEQPRRARAPGVILASTHPATAGHPKPRAPSRLPVALT